MKDKCTLTNADLVLKANKLVSQLAKSGWRSWSLKVPVDFNNDPDIIFVELGNRLKRADKLIKLQEEYIEFLNKANESPISIAAVHGWKCTDDIIQKEMRKAIQELADATN